MPFSLPGAQRSAAEVDVSVRACITCLIEQSTFFRNALIWRLPRHQLSLYARIAWTACMMIDEHLVDVNALFLFIRSVFQHAVTQKVTYDLSRCVCVSLNRVEPMISLGRTQTIKARLRRFIDVK